MMSDPSEVTRAHSKTRVMRELEALDRRLRRTTIAVAIVALIELVLAACMVRVWWAR